jgi:tRNA 2-thiocytidine biosynthesis protein TtcA
MVDQTLLIPEQYSSLVWFLFPSEILQSLLELSRKQPKRFEEIESFNSSTKRQEDEEWQTPYHPRDYNKEKYAFEFSHEYNASMPAGFHENKSTDDEIEVRPDAGQQNSPENLERVEVKAEVREDEYGEEEFPFNFGDELETQPTKKEKIKLLDVPKDIKAQVGAAIRDFEMIKDGDKVLIALSGGKDSLCMIHILKYFQSVAPIQFELGAVTVDPQVNEYKPQPLIPYMESIGVPYWIESDAIVERAKDCMQKNSICSFCSRMKRGMIYNCARREGYNVIAMGQHLDDLAESFVMSTFHNGSLRTMKASYTIDAGDLRVIRPLVTCREALFRAFSEKNNLPVIADNCPACFSAPKERHRIKLMLAQQEHLFPSLFSSILKTITPLMRGNLKDGVLNAKADGSDEEEFDGALGKVCTTGACPL